MTNQGINIQHPKLRGEWAELRFMARAAEHGFRVSKPFGDCASYDVTVEHHGQFLRVQVKSTKSVKKGSHSYVCDLRRRDKAPYTPDRVDFFAIYVIPRDLWYIFPAQAAIAANHSLVLSPDLPDSKHAPYKEAWRLLYRGRVQDRLGTPAPGCPAEPSPAGSSHPESTLDPGHPFHHAEKRMLEIHDRMRDNPFLKPRR